MPASSSDHPPHAGSPIATGGGGATFEQQVAAYYLTALLLRSTPRGASGGITHEVRLQRKALGHPLDDIVVHLRSDAGPHYERQLDLQVKRNLTYGPADAQFNSVMAACWQTYKAPGFRLGADRFGVAVGIYKSDVSGAYQDVLKWANTSSSPDDFFARISLKSFSSQAQRQFVTTVRSTIDQIADHLVTDQELWEFLRSLVILHFDFPENGGRDRTYTLDLLRTMLRDPTPAGADTLLSHLTTCAALGHETAGSFSYEHLMERLSDLPLQPAPDCRHDLERIREHAALALSQTRSDIGGFHLNRTGVLNQAYNEARQAPLLLLAGQAGAGKSAALKELVLTHLNDGNILYLDGKRIEGKSWDGFAHRIGLKRPLKELLVALAAGGPHLWVVADGLDKVKDEGARQVINDLLHTLRSVFPGQDGRCSFIATARDENLEDLYRWLDWPGIERVNPVTVPPLTDDEVQQVTEFHPELAPLRAMPHLNPVLKLPFHLDLLRRKQIGVRLPAIRSEFDVARFWWEEYVGGAEEPLGTQRRQALLDLGRRACADGSPRLSGRQLDAGALASLAADGILHREGNHYSFTHDLIEDWVLYHAVDEASDRLGELIETVRYPSRLSSGFQLLCWRLLEVEQDVTAWMKLYHQLEQAGEVSLRWRQVMLSGMLASVHLASYLPKVRAFLLKGEGLRLCDLLAVMRTTQVDADFTRLRSALLTASSAEEVELALRHSPVPRMTVWQPVVNWLLNALQLLPMTARPEVIRVLQIWQEKTLLTHPTRRQVGELAWAWLNDVGADENPAFEYEGRLRQTLLLSADAVPELVTAHLKAVVQTPHWYAKRHVLFEYGLLIDRLPGPFVEFVLAVLYAAPAGNEGPVSGPPDTITLGVRNSPELVQPDRMLALVHDLLDTNEAAGLRLVHGIVNRAIDCWRHAQRQPMDGELAVPLPTVVAVDGNRQEFWGDVSVYGWHRGLGDAPPAALFAVVGLTQWLEKEVCAQQRDAGDLFASVLRESTCVAVIGACMQVALSYPELGFAAALPLVESSLVWRLDRTYRQEEARMLRGMPWISVDEHDAVIGGMQSDGIRCVNYLAPYYMLSGEESHRERFQSALRNAKEHLPFLFAHECEMPDVRQQLESEVANWQAYGESDRWRVEETDDAAIIRFDQPEVVQQHNEMLSEQMADEIGYRALLAWAQETLSEGKEAFGLTVAEALTHARAMYEPTIWRVPPEEQEDFAVRSLVLTVIAASLRTAPAALVDASMLDWACEAILSAPAESALAPGIVEAFDALIGAGWGGARPREIAATWCGTTFAELIDGLSHFDSLWQHDPVLYWNLLSAILTRVTGPANPEPTAEHDRVERIVDQHLTNLSQSITPPLPRFGYQADGMIYIDLLQLAGSLLFGRDGVKQLPHTAVLNLADDVISWVMPLYLIEGGPRPRSATAIAVSCLTPLAVCMTPQEVERHILTPLERTWPDAPHVSHLALNTLLVHINDAPDEPIPPALLCAWKRIAGWILAAPHEQADVMRKMADTLLFGGFDHELPTPWPHLSLFTEEIDAWVDRFGHESSEFHHLLAVLQGPAQALELEQVLGWLQTCFKKVRDIRLFCEVWGNGQFTAELLLAMLKQNAAELRRSQSGRTAFTYVTDRLVEGGVPLATTLQRALR